MVAPGDTEVVPPATGATAPTPLLIVNEVALVVVQVSVEDPPTVIDTGAAERVQTGAAGAGASGNVHEPSSVVAAELKLVAVELVQPGTVTIAGGGAGGNVHEPLSTVADGL